MSALCLGPVASYRLIPSKEAQLCVVHTAKRVPLLQMHLVKKELYCLELSGITENA